MYKNANNHTTKALFLTVVGVAITTTLTLLPNTANAWEFETCSSTLSTQINLRPPQAMIMLDRSGSMTGLLENHTLDPEQNWGLWRYFGSIWPDNQRRQQSNNINANWADPNPFPLYDPVFYPNGLPYWTADFRNQSPMIEPSYGQHDSSRYLRTFWFNDPRSLWDVAIRELKAVLATYDGPQPRIKFGLGTYTNWFTSDVVINAEGWGMIWKEASEYNNSTDFMRFFDHPQQGGPTIGATPTQRAIDAMRTSETITNQNTSNAGILITDGAPNLYEINGIAYAGSNDEPHAAAVDAACRHSEVAPLYVIGFSSLSDPKFNNIIAAAGNTGECRDQSNNLVDVCNSGFTSSQMMARLRANTITCTGAYQADSSTEFKDALDAITNQIACTYPLDILNTPNGQAPEDPEGTRVFLGQCTPGPGTHTVWGSEFDASKSTGGPYRAARTELGFACSGECGAVNSSGATLTYDLPTTPGQTNTLRIRVADYKHNCSDTLKVEVRVDSNTVLGTWTGTGINDWSVIEYNFTPTADRTFITVRQMNDAYCGGNGSCNPACSPLADDLNTYVDWVKVVDPQAGCLPDGGQPYIAPGTSGNGWTFTENRTQVQLVGQACTDVKNRNYSEVVTQVACPCEQIPGGVCKTESGASCPIGFWECTEQWEDICVPDDACDQGECAPVTQHDLTRRQPNVQMVVDNSGSMAWKIRNNSNGNNTPGHADEARHWIAKRVLAEVVNDSYQGPLCHADGTNCDKLRLGLHFWSGSKKTWRSVQEDMTKAMIESAFDSYRPTGGTYFHLATELLRDENGLKDANAANIGIMVTDGEPSSRSTFQNAMQITCNNRKRATAPIATYVLGFGIANGEQINSAVAAAGGTGICCLGSTCDLNAPINPIDPCDYQGLGGNNGLDALSKSIHSGNSSDFNGGKVTCTGNIAASNGDVLKAELQKLFANLECVFPLTLLPDMESASTNPVGTKVDIFLKNTGDLVKVPHLSDTAGQAQFVAQLTAKGIPNASSYINDGWSFANAGRTAVRLSENICDQIQEQEINRVDTQVCDVCEQTGQACEVTCRPGIDDNCGDDGFLYGRCRVGEYICIAGNEVCVQTRNPMPEICNGIDDSCDGSVDNLSDNPADWSEPKWSLVNKDEGQFAALACHNQDLCGCINGQADEIHGLASDDDEFFSFLDGQYSSQNTGAANCYCGAGLTAPSTAQPSAPSAPSAPHTKDAACSISGAADSRPLDAWWLVAVFGLFGIARAKRRYLN